MGTVQKQGTITSHPTSYDTTHYSWASVSSSYPISNAYTDSSSTSYAQVSWKTGANAETYVYLRFDLSAIPADATINSVTAKAKGYVNTTNSSRVTSRQMQLAAGTTLKGSALTISTSTNEQTFSNTGSWTRAELLTAGVRFYVKRGTSNTSSTYNLRMYGATITVNYTWLETTYTITVSNSTTATVTPTSQDVVEGNDAVVTSNTISGLQVTDNGVDVTSQFIETEKTGATYSVQTADGASYGFALNNNDYYESQNTGVNKSAAVCIVNINTPVAATVTFSYINYAEEAYDFGVFGNIDVPLTNDYYPAGSNGATISETSYRLACNSSTYNKSTVQTLTYSVSAGDSQIYVKYSKDDASAANNDSLQFQVSITLDEPFTPGIYYEYTIQNVQADHTIVVGYSGGGGEQMYIKVNGSWTAVSAVYQKVNGSWVQQSNLSTLFSTTANYVKGN